MTSCNSDESVIEKPVSTLVSMSESDYRPNYHFTPPAHWMNDPNGLVYYAGEYHLFYQYNPNGNTWGPMNWGHTISTDLFNWKDLPIALYPDGNGAAFSGSAVVDSNNTTGFKSGEESPLVAIYTSAGAKQAQSLAYSTDNGRNWSKYEQNPVLPNPGINDFRDPKVSWNESFKKWVMVLAKGNVIGFYSSSDLKNWTFESDFGLNFGAHGGVWECPDLFELTVEGTTTKKWVLLVSINPGGPNGGSATQYFIGDFDGKTFAVDQNLTSWIDYGTDNYAGVTYNNIPTSDGRRLLIGWMSNWNYAQQVPTTTWRSTMTVPRVITLVQNNQGYNLRFNPIDELSKYNSHKDTTILQAKNHINITNNDILKSGSYEVAFEVDFAQTDSLKLTIGNSAESLLIVFDKQNGRVTIDRSKSGLVGFNSGFKQTIVCPCFTTNTDQKVDIRLLIDKTSLELFWNKGDYSITSLFFPKYKYDFLKIEGGVTYNSIKNLTLIEISKSIQR